MPTGCRWESRWPRARGATTCRSPWRWSWSACSAAGYGRARSGRRLGRVGAQLRRRLRMAVVAGASSAEIDAPIEKVWKAVEDVEKAPDWQGGMKDLQALERDGDGRPTLVETEADAKVTTIKTKVRFVYDAPTRLSWKQEKGDLKSMVGSWELEDLG